MSIPAIFTVNVDGQVKMLVPKADTAGGALEIVGNDTGEFFLPDQTGVILHVTGNSGLVARNYFDANANYALLAGRRYNGTQALPTKVLNGEVLLRLVAQAATQATTEPAVFQAFGPARIEFVATQDQQPVGGIFVENQPGPGIINMYVLGYNREKKITTLNSDTKSNLKTYLDQYRMLTDQVRILDGFVVNIGVRFRVVVFKGFNMNEVLARCIDAFGNCCGGRRSECIGC